MHTTERVLMVVKTYPTPSADHGETVCTAGIRLRDGAWVRIYPFPFRLADLEAKFKKWQVIEVPLTKATKDPRPESYKLHDVTSIKLGEEIGTENTTWSTRMKHIEPTIMPSVEAVLNGIPPKGDQNWGPTIRPVEIQTTGAQFSAEYVGEAWTPKEQAKLDKAEQLALGSLFQTATRAYRPLEKIPYDFYLTFQDLTGASYTYRILDWEIAELFRRMRAQHGSPQVALEKVRHKIEDQILTAGNRVILILGNVHFQYKQRQLVIDGFIYPKRPKPRPAAQPGLFDSED
ncbi:hypothetical protein [Deinococcus knuensis]|nr:hypothetical protein [Deinococcus knuensis]